MVSTTIHCETNVQTRDFLLGDDRDHLKSCSNMRKHRDSSSGRSSCEFNEDESNATISELSSPNDSANSQDEIDDGTYVSQFQCPTESDEESDYFDNDENDEIFIEKHVSSKLTRTLDRKKIENFQRKKRSKKKVNAKRQIKSKDGKSIRNNSHNKHLYIHHRIAKRISLDPPSYHFLPSAPAVPLHSIETLRSIIHSIRVRHKYRNAPWMNHEFNDSHLDETPFQIIGQTYRDYTINEFNIPDEPSFDDDMIHFLLEMQNRDLSPEDYEMLLRLDERVQRKTVNTNILNTLVTIQVDETNTDEQCSICMEKYSLGQILKQLPCQHVFHSTCIEDYLKDFSNQCPLDNLPLN